MLKIGDFRRKDKALRFCQICFAPGGQRGAAVRSRTLHRCKGSELFAKLQFLRLISEKSFGDFAVQR